VPWVFLYNGHNGDLAFSDFGFTAKKKADFSEKSQLIEWAQRHAIGGQNGFVIGDAVYSEEGDLLEIKDIQRIKK
jgi:7-keto-8-aminopelargonate synthetase-like enzyme